MICRTSLITIVCGILVVARASSVEKCSYEFDADTGSSLLQGFSQQSQLLEMSVDPEGDGLTQDLSHDPHTKNHAYAKVKHPAKHPGGHIKRPFSTPAQHSKKVPAKQPTFSAHFRIGGTGEGSPEQVGAASAEQITDVLTGSESSPANLKTPPSSTPTEEEEKESLEKTETQSESTSLSVSEQQNTGLTKKPQTWIKSQDAKMQAAMSLANALLSLQVTPPEFIEKSLESATDQTQETTVPTTTMTTTSSANIGSHPDVALHQGQSVAGNHTWQSLLETFHSQMRSNFVCLFVTIINGPLQTLAIALLLFLGHALRKEVMELKASNAELMQKVYDVTTAPATPTLRSDRRWFGRSESRADWQRGTEVVGGRE